MAPALDSSPPLPPPPHILWLNVQKNICSIAVIYLFRGEGGKSRNLSLDSVEELLMASFSQAMPAFSQRKFAAAAALGASSLPLDFGFQN